MATTFPDNLDTLTNPTSTDTLDSPSHSDQHSDLNDAVEALETKVGTDSSAVTTSHDYKLAHLTASDITDITASAAELNKTDGVTGDIVGTTDTQTLTNKTLSTGSTIDTNVTVTEVLKKVYPVGCIYITITSTNPSTVFGFGTWSAFGAGKVLIGLDSTDGDFDEAEETGGAKTHTHTLSTSGYAEIYGSLDGYIDMKRVSTSSWTTSQRATATGVANNTTSNSLGTSLGGSTDSGNSLQPYVVVYMFKRTA